MAFFPTYTTKPCFLRKKRKKTWNKNILWRPRKAVKKLLYCTCRTLTKETRVLKGGGNKRLGFFPRKKTKEHRFFGKNVCFGRILLSPFLLSCCTFMEFVWGGGKNAAGAFFGALKTETKKMKPNKKGMQRKSTFDDFF